MRRLLVALALVAGWGLVGAYIAFGPSGKARADNTRICTSPTPTTTSVGLAAVPVPASPLTGRAWIDITVSIENTGSPKVKCRADGTSPVMGTGNVGDVLAVGDTAHYDLGAGQIVKCIADTAATYVTSLECKNL